MNILRISICPMMLKKILMKNVSLSNERLSKDWSFVEINYDYVNAIFLPRRDFRVSHSSHWQSRFLGFSNPDSIVRQLRQQLLAIDRPHIEQCQTQRAWLTHASRIWDMITKSAQVKSIFISWSTKDLRLFRSWILVGC